MIDVTVVLLDDGLPTTSIAPIEIFTYAGVLWRMLQGEPAQPLFRVRAASIDGRAPRNQLPISVQPNAAIHDIDRTDLIVVPTAGLDLSQVCARNAALVPWLRHWRERGAAIAGICTGVGLLAEAGMLEGRPATTHWAIVAECRRRYPGVHWQPERFITESDGLYCSGGLYASIDMSIYLVEKYFGHEVAVQTSKSLLVETPRTWQAIYSAEPPPRVHGDERVGKVQQWMYAHFRTEVKFDDLAAEVGMSPRTFARHFKAATGETPMEYLHRLRINAAKHLLEAERKTVQEVSVAVGYEDAAYFRSLFKRYTGIGPQAYRERFGIKRSAPT
jgi:transcriptional regulator GlxA family with amidase domain